eukprot:COSAG03_NODE_17221_length_381_cov_0.542553_1_plen_54_part_01
MAVRTRQQLSLSLSLFLSLSLSLTLCPHQATTHRAAGCAKPVDRAKVSLSLSLS